MSSPAAESTQVGPYRLIGQIGEGGMGLVYLARAPDERRVAVKILRPSVVGDAHGRARLAREVTSLRRVRSPRIAEVYDADPWGETPYVVTRYVPGPSLREVVTLRGPLAGPALLRFARGLAQALEVVHRADVLHRDVKPSNVLIEGGDPVLIDFGLAQLSDDMTLTQTGWLLGTPGYLAPEILYGDGPTPAADVHAWAATVTYAATGRGPYGSGPAMAILDRARRGETNLQGVPPELGDVLAAALRADPANRPTARQLVDWLDARLAKAPPVDAAAVPADVSKAATSTAVPTTAPGAGFATDHAGARRLAAGPHDTRLSPSPATAPDGRQSLSTTSAATTPTSMAPPSTEHEGAPAQGRLRRLSFWVLILLIVMAATVAAPVVTWCWVACVGWILRTLAITSTTLRAWRIARGPRRHDAALAGLLVPWFALRGLAASAVNALSVAVAAGGFFLLARFGPDAVETPALLVAGLAAGLVAWGGPASHHVRAGGRVVTDNLPRSGLATAILGLLLLGLATGLLATQQIVGTAYTPFSS
jgi:serine/threonine protein kinase